MKSTATLAILSAISTVAFAADASVTPAFAFSALKKLEGRWTGPAMKEGMPLSNHEFHVTAGGSAVQETIFPGTKMEMVSLFHMNKGDLVMTHYCVLGNQPRMKFNPRKSTATTLVFDFDGGTNLNPRRDPHMRSLTLTLPGAKGAQKLVMTGTSWEGGKEQDGCTSTLTRRK